jgi:hypothetical protein
MQNMYIQNQRTGWVVKDILQEIQYIVYQAISSFQERADGKLDFSEASLLVVDEMLTEASAFHAELTDVHAKLLVEYLGCYILEVAHRQFGGVYYWHDARNQPILVVGEPEAHIALLAWDKVRGRLMGNATDNIPFFFSVFAEQARMPLPGEKLVFG